MLCSKCLKTVLVFMSVWVLLLGFTTVTLAQEPVVTPKPEVVPQQLNTAYVYFAHLAPFTSNVAASALTIRLNGKTLPELKYGQTSEDITITDFEQDEEGYIPLPQTIGEPLIEFLVNGTVISTSNRFFRSYHSYTFALIGDGVNQPLTVQLFEDAGLDGLDGRFLRVINAMPFITPTTELNFDMRGFFRFDEMDFWDYSFNDLAYTGLSLGTDMSQKYHLIESNKYSVVITRSDQPQKSFLAFPTILFGQAGGEHGASIFLVGNGSTQPYSYVLSNFKHDLITESLVYIPLLTYSPPQYVPPYLTVQLTEPLFDIDPYSDDGDYVLRWKNYLTSTDNFELQFSYNTPTFSPATAIKTLGMNYESYDAIDLDRTNWPGTHYWRIRPLFGDDQYDNEYPGYNQLPGSWSNIVSVKVKPYVYIEAQNLSSTNPLKVTLSGNGLQKTITLSKDDDVLYFATVPPGTYTITTFNNNIRCTGGGGDRTETVTFKNNTYTSGDLESGLYTITSCGTISGWE